MSWGLFCGIISHNLHLSQHPEPHVSCPGTRNRSHALIGASFEQQVTLLVSLSLEHKSWKLSHLSTQFSLWRDQRWTETLTEEISQEITARSWEILYRVTAWSWYHLITSFRKPRDNDGWVTGDQHGMNSLVKRKDKGNPGVPTTGSFAWVAAGLHYITILGHLSYCSFYPSLLLGTCSARWHFIFIWTTPLDFHV